MKKVFTLFFAMAFYSLQAQFLVSAEKVGEVLIADNQNFLASYDLELYKVIYNTVNVQGEPDIASGLMILPMNAADQCLPMAVVHHGTVNGRQDVPSRVTGHYELGTTFCGSGFIGVMPDLIGLGDSPGIHTYIHAETAASASLDMMRAVKEYCSASPINNLNDQVFITGYSQGGHTTMANFKDLEENHPDEFNITAVAPMSGPYNISRTMVDFTLGDTEYGFSSYLAAVSLSMKAAYPDELAEYTIETLFKEEFLEIIKRYENEEIGLGDLNDLLEEILMQTVGKITPKDMMTEAALADIINEGGIINQVLTQQNVHDWVPVAPMIMYYCTEDEQVTFECSIVALEAMTAAGAENVTALDMGPLTHNGCVEPAIIDCLLWWIGLQEIQENCITDVEDIFTYKAPLIIGSNISSSEIEVYIQNSDKINKAKLSVISIQGEVIQQINSPQDYLDIDVSHLMSGMYFLNLTSDGQVLRTEKFVVD